MSTILILKLFIIGFLLNFFYEVLHSELYATFKKMKYVERVSLICVMALKDAFWVVLFYVLVALAAGVNNILLTPLSICMFALISVLFSYFDEKISISLKRWEYSSAMPQFSGVGITPFLQIVVTGFATLYIVFFLFV